MTKIAIQWLVRTLSNDVIIYTAIEEAIVNAIHAIEDNSNINSWEIKVSFIRKSKDIQDSLIPLNKKEKERIEKIVIEDNGIWFSDINKDAFDTVFHTWKIKRWGKWFWRVTYLKFFDDIKIESVYTDYSKHISRSRTFVPDDNDIFRWFLQEDTDNETTWTKITFSSIKDQYVDTLDKDFDVVVWKIIEKLLWYFVDDTVKLPKITFFDSDWGKSICGNDYLKSSSKMEVVWQQKINIGSENLLVKFVKIYRSQSSHSICLSAHHRIVTTDPISDFIKEFWTAFQDESKERYIIKCFVIWDYLDNNVNHERSKFLIQEKDIPTKQKDMFSNSSKISREEILVTVSSILKSKFQKEYEMRREAKKKLVADFLANNPWHNEIKDELNIDVLSERPDEREIDDSIHKILYDKALIIKKSYQKIKNSSLETVNPENMTKFMNDIDILAKNRLAEYIGVRKMILDIFKKVLEQGEDWKYESEAKIHNILYPMKSASDNVLYNDHNLWMIDERLSFFSYISSDNSIDKDNPHGRRWDIVCFDNPIAIRSGEELHNPIVVYEIKKPQRKWYPESEEHPLKQICSYIKSIRSGTMNNYKGRPINANESTPWFWYLVCDITPKIEEFAKDYSLTKTSDGLWYVGFHIWYNVYLEVISFDKLVKDAIQRNKIFFHKLWIDNV